MSNIKNQEKFWKLSFCGFKMNMEFCQLIIKNEALKKRLKWTYGINLFVILRMNKLFLVIDRAFQHFVAEIFRY